MKKKTKIYLADLVHNFLGGGSYMFPLNIGFIASYAKKAFGDEAEITLFKYPDMLVKRLKEAPPDILGLSSYTWNTHLNSQVSRLMKSLNPAAMVVYGGPNVNHTDGGYRDFFSKNPCVDFYVINEGEVGFSNLLSRYFESGQDLRAMKGAGPVDGCVFFDGAPVAGARLPRMQSLDEIPSPYLSGILDEFFKFDLIPIVETNRGCPYACTYCAQGIGSQYKVKFFDIERVLSELDYIAGHVNNTNLLCFADANFGIAQRDIRIAEHIRNLQQTKGYPRRCTINWIKTRQSIELAKIMGQSTYLVSSLQSLDPIVLKNIKRHNIDYSHFKEIVDQTNEMGGVSGTEIILALPGETKESHLNSLRKLFDWDVSYIICYNCLLIDGSELTLPEQRGEYKLRTRFRLVDSAFGHYDSISSFECEEGIRSTSAMSEDEILFFRPVHWLIQFFWNYRCYFELLKFMNGHGINPVDFIVALINNAASAPASVKGIFQDFGREAVEEWFESPEALCKYYEIPENFAKLESGEVGKMNGKYTWRVILECKNDFDRFVKDTASGMLPDHSEAIADIVLYASNALLDFSQNFNFTAKQLKFSHDVIAWKESKYKSGLSKKECAYSFVFPDEKKGALEVLLNQYKHSNKNVTMRKMTEHMRITDIYYDVSPV
ncbi:MAG: radical SAM protein [Nitrospirae bacterium]|nr:MAG: radical SAM protein [Nitrospirota bacterium]